MYLLGIDIGGTKCAVSLGRSTPRGGVERLWRCEPHPTAGVGPQQMLEQLAADVQCCRERAPQQPMGIGISCGGPLDAARGVILSPPNLPGWDEVPVTAYFQKRTGLPAYLCNDANAGALAEWRVGAGQGCRHMVFLTFGTGLGAGLILNGRLYEGACGAAGEAGHIRLAAYGPAGYGKPGSFEGFCSGGGLAQLAQTMLRAELQAGRRPALCPERAALHTVTARDVGVAARYGDALAGQILAECGRRLGSGLSILIDLLNPERIVLGGVFARNHQALWQAAEPVLAQEALPDNRAACQVVPSQLSEAIGDIAALMVARYRLEQATGGVA